MNRLSFVANQIDLPFNDAQVFLPEVMNHVEASSIYAWAPGDENGPDGTPFEQDKTTSAYLCDQLPTSQLIEIDVEQSSSGTVFRVNGRNLKTNKVSSASFSNGAYDLIPQFATGELKFKTADVYHEIDFQGHLDHQNPIVATLDDGSINTYSTLTGLAGALGLPSSGWSNDGQILEIRPSTALRLHGKDIVDLSINGNAAQITPGTESVDRDSWGIVADQINRKLYLAAQPLDGAAFTALLSVSSQVSGGQFLES